MPRQPLTDAQSKLVQQLQQDAQTPKFVVDIVTAAMRLRNTSAPSGVMNRSDAEQELFELIDEVS